MKDFEADELEEWTRKDERERVRLLLERGISVLAEAERVAAASGWREGHRQQIGALLADLRAEMALGGGGEAGRQAPAAEPTPEPPRPRSSTSWPPSRPASSANSPLASPQPR